MNGVIETATGDLLRSGYTDFENDGSFDSETQSYRTDVPGDAKIRGNREESQMHRWNGTSWVLVDQPLSDYKKIRHDEIDARTEELISETGFIFDGKTFSLSANAQRNFDRQLDQELKYSFPIDISTKDNDTYSLAANDNENFWTAMKNGINTHLDTGLVLNKSVFDAVDKTAVDAVVDNR